MKSKRLLLASLFHTTFFTSACRTSANSDAKSMNSSDSNAKLSDDLKYIKSDAGKMVEESANKLGKPANRDFHSKGMCVKGTFTVNAANIPEGYRVGLFAQDGVYPMYARFSNGRPGRDSNDHDASVFGFGIKLIGVPGQKFDMQSLGSTKPKNSNQDWNLATGQTFPIPTAAIYREQRELGPAAFGLKHPLITKALLGSLRRIDSFFAASYHSQVALHYGEDHIAKFSVAPCNGVETDITAADAAKRSSDYLRQDLATKVANSGGCFVFRAQIREADRNLTAINSDWAKKYPSDNPTILWPEDVMPYHILAKIEFPKRSNIADLQPTCEALSINPGNALQSFRPIESDTLMRSRFLSAYEGSVTTRSALNGKQQSEPSPVTNLQGWLNE